LLLSIAHLHRWAKLSTSLYPERQRQGVPCPSGTLHCVSHQPHSSLHRVSQDGICKICIGLHRFRCRFTFKSHCLSAVSLLSFRKQPQRQLLPLFSIAHPQVLLCCQQVLLSTRTVLCSVLQSVPRDCSMSLLSIAHLHRCGSAAIAPF